MEDIWIKGLKTVAIISLFGALVYADTQTPMMTGAPTDEQIVNIVETANNAEIDASKLAKKSANPQVADLAKNMIDAHTKSNADTSALARSLSLKMVDSQVSDDIKKDSKNNLAQLKNLKGPDFDKAYVEALIAAHEDVLDNLNNTLIPSAKDAHLKQLLVDTRKVVETHLGHAKMVETALNK